MNAVDRIRFTASVAWILSAFCTSSAQECFDDGNEFCIDQNDILSVDLLPGSFLFADERARNDTAKSIANDAVDGSIYGALNEMEYHRKKMNEYLCHGYMAEEIVKIASSPRTKRRLNLAERNAFQDLMGAGNVTVHDKLLSDEGSSKYRDWLQRRTTLDDVYRHYTPQKKIHKKQGTQEANFEGIQEFDGEVTGYAMQAPLPSGKVGYYDEQSENDDHMISSSSGHSFLYGNPYGLGGDHFMHHTFPAVHEEHYYTAPVYHDQEEDYPKAQYKSKGNELTIKDFFEIALTALAFLSFGLFIIQLLMNATTNMNTTMATMMTNTAKRLRRSTDGSPFAYVSNEELNELSHNVLRSIEAALVADMDAGNCMRRILCEDNRRSTQSRDARRIWIPVWSLGMSWVSGRVAKESPWSAMLDSVKASILGLGGADCEFLYPDCDLRRERIKRRRRRRK